MRLVQTCSACPEQYDVFDGDTYVGYLRLRFGYFTAQHQPSGYTVYESQTDGDGSFTENERDEHLAKALQALKNYILMEKERANDYSKQLGELLAWESSQER